MAVRDLASKIDVKQVFNAAISADGTTTSTVILDTKDFELGLCFAVGATAYTDGSYLLGAVESDDSGLAGSTAVPVTKLNGGGTAFPSVTAAVASDGGFVKFGIFSNARYVALTIVASGVTSGATLNGMAIQAGEYLPTE